MGAEGVVTESEVGGLGRESHSDIQFCLGHDQVPGTRAWAV